MDKDDFFKELHDNQFDIGNRIVINPVGIYLPIDMVNFLKESDVTPFTSFQNYLLILKPEQMKKASFVHFLKARSLGHVFAVWELNNSDKCVFLC